MGEKEIDNTLPSKGRKKKQPLLVATFGLEKKTRIFNAERAGKKIEIVCPEIWAI